MQIDEESHHTSDNQPLQTLLPTSLTQHPEKVQLQEITRSKRKWIGIILAFIASTLFPLAALIVKGLPQYHPFSVTFWRFVGVFLPAVPMAWYYNNQKPIFKPLTTHPKRCSTITLILLRCLTGSSAVIFQFYSLQYISMADSSVISFSTPVFVTFLAHFLLGEKLGLVPILAGIFGIIGVAVIARPPLLTGEKEVDVESLLGTGLALGCMICATFTFILLRKLRQLHYAMLNVFFGTWGLVECLLLSCIIWRLDFPHTQLHWGLAALLALLSFVTQLCMTLAFKFEQAATISLVRTGDPIFAFIWQFIVFGTVPDRFSVIGASLVLIGIIAVGLRKWISDLSPDNSIRRYFGILLK